MTDTPSTVKTLPELTVGVPKAGRKTLLAALPELAEARMPEHFRLCVLDAERMDAPAQIALVDRLAADPTLEVIFALNKADRITGPRTVMTRTLALLRERGFSAPLLYPVCALAARLLATPSGALDPEELSAQSGYYYRYGPGDNSLSAFAVTNAPALILGSRELTPEQLRLALENTGVPALARRLAELIPAEEPVPAEEPAVVEETVPVEEPAAIEEPVPAEEPAVIEEAPPAEEPAPAEETVSVEEPVLVEEAPPAEEPAPVEAPAPTEEPAPPAEPIDEAPAPEELLAELMELAGVAEEEPEGEAPDAVEPAAEEAPIQADEDAPTDEPLTDEVPEDEAPAPESEGGSDGADLTDPLVHLRLAAENANCAELLTLARAVPQQDLPDECKEPALDLLHQVYTARQAEELEALTQAVDELELPELRALLDRINGGPYTVQARTPYAMRVNQRIDALQGQALAELCAGIEEADSQTLARIRRSLERADCAEVLKTDYFRRIEARQEALDLETLERITAGAEDMSEKELRSLAVTLEANNWNPKYILAYRHRIELCREAAVVRELDRELEGLDDMERRELLSLRERMAGKDLPGRFLAAPLARIDERLYRMDMLRLMALDNDFDLLDFDGIDTLRAMVGRGDYVQRARRDYLTRLLERENALILENTDARAQLARQLIGQHKLRMADFTFASKAPAYQERLADFWDGSGLEQPRDVPVFLFENGSDYAFTGERFYYKVGRDLAFLPLADVERFQTLRQHMSLALQIVRKDNSYLLTTARISRSGAERTLAFLNECLRRWNEPGMAGNPSSGPIRTRRFEASDYTAPVEPWLPDAEMAQELFHSRYAAAKLRDGSLVRPGEEEQRTRRLLASFGLPETTPLVWYNASSLPGSVRDGIALGPRGIYQKDSKLPVQVIPLEEIHTLTWSGKLATLTILRGQTLRLELSGAIFPLVEDYVRTIQLGTYLEGRERRP